jgi:hypothetical protein
MRGLGAGALRLLLLALLIVGVVGMHTVGHSGDHGSWHGPSPEPAGHGAAAAAPPGGATSWLADAADPCDGHCDGGLAPVPAVPPGPDPGPDGTGLLIVCLAVLGGLGALALLAGALTRRRRAVARAPGARRARPVRVAPTLVHPFSIRLVEVAVLRT